MAQIDPLDDFITASAQVLDLPLKKEWKDTIKSNLKVTLDHAARVTEFDLPDDAEPASVFRA
jgi:hypothetical protein